MMHRCLDVSIETNRRPDRRGTDGRWLRRILHSLAVFGLVIGAWRTIAYAASPPTDRVQARIEAVIEPTLSQMSVIARYRWIPPSDRQMLWISKIADRALSIPSSLPPAAEPQLFADGYDRGGFRGLRIAVDGQPCRRLREERVDRMPVVGCEGAFAAGRPVDVVVETTLQIPDRFGPFGRRRQQLTLLGGWFPAIGRPDRPPPVGSTSARVRIPNRFAAVLGTAYSPFVPTRGRGARWVEATSDGVSIPLVVLPARTGTRSLAGGRVRWISGRRHTSDHTALRQARLTASAVERALDLLTAEGFRLPSPEAPLLIVEAPLRRNLARAGPGLVLVSDRAFRLPPFERVFRFHRFPVIREVMTAWAWQQVRRGPYRHVTADAVGAFLRDRFVRAETGYAEDLFDVLGFWSFIPAVDSLLYAPQTAFIGAYFQLVNESDPLRTNLVDPPSAWPRGRILYEKLLDRVGPRQTAAAMRRLAVGGRWTAVLADALGTEAAEPFMAMWLGPYPRHQYALKSWRSQPVTGPACAPAAACHEARVAVERTGDPALEPLQLRLTDDDGQRRFVWTKTSSAALRTITATLSAPLDLVELDPRGRMSETPSLSVPSPKLDNRSRARWRLLLNNFNFAGSPTGGTVNTSLDLGLSKVRDVHWRYGLTAGFSPQAFSVSGRVRRRFGPTVTPDRLARWIGVGLSGQRLRADFAGEADDSFALNASLFYGYDDRKTAWAPEAGSGFRAALTYNHLFGRLSTLDPDGAGVTRDAIALTIRGVESWRVEGRHQFSLRGSVGAYVAGRPQSQLLYVLGGRQAVRGYIIDAEVGRFRAIGSGEWVHTLLSDANENVVELNWATKLDGALFADVAAVTDTLDGDLGRQLRADIGYGFRIYLDYFGIRPGVMAIDVAFPLLDDQGRFRPGAPQVYIDFSQSFFLF